MEKKGGRGVGSVGMAMGQGRPQMGQVRVQKYPSKAGYRFSFSKPILVQGEPWVRPSPKPVKLIIYLNII